MVISFDMDSFIEHELGPGWIRTLDAVGGRLHTAIRPDLRSNDFACNVAVHEIPTGEPADLAATIPTAPVLLASDGVAERGATAELLFVDEEFDTTQWIGYRFGSEPAVQIIVSSATPDWPAVAATVARLAERGRQA